MPANYIYWKKTLLVAVIITITNNNNNNKLYLWLDQRKLKLIKLLKIEKPVLPKDTPYVNITENNIVNIIDLFNKLEPSIIKLH